MNNQTESADSKRKKLVRQNSIADEQQCSTSNVDSSDSLEKSTYNHGASTIFDSTQKFDLPVASASIPAAVSTKVSAVNIMPSPVLECAPSPVSASALARTSIPSHNSSLLSSKDSTLGVDSTIGQDENQYHTTTASSEIGAVPDLVDVIAPLQVPVPAPRTSFFKLRNVMGLKVDIETARRKSLSEAASEQWDDFAMKREDSDEEEEMMTECEDDLDDHWNTNDNAGTGDREHKVPETSENDKDDSESFAFDDEIEFLAHLEDVSEASTAHCNDEHRKTFQYHDDSDDEDRYETVYEADFRMDERFFLHTIQEDSVENEMENSDETEDDQNSIHDDYEESEAEEKPSLGNISPESNEGMISKININVSPKSYINSITSPESKQEDFQGSICSDDISCNEACERKLSSDMLSQTKTNRASKSDMESLRSPAPGEEDFCGSVCSDDISFDYACEEKISRNMLSQAKVNMSENSDIDSLITPEPVEIYDNSDVISYNDACVGETASNVQAQTDTNVSPKSEVSSLQPSSTPFHRGGLDRSTIRSKKGQRRTVSRNNQNLDQQPQADDLEYCQEAHENLAIVEETELKSYQTISSHDGKHLQNLENSSKRHHGNKTIRPTDSHLNDGEKATSGLNNILSEPRAPLVPSHSQVQCEVALLNRQASYKADIKTWEERRAEKLKKLPLNCVFSAEI
jgi:hypothetical protein